MTTRKMTKYVVRRTNTNHEDPTAPDTILGFVKAGTFTEAAEAAHLRWGVDGVNQLIVLVPVNTATEHDLRLAILAEADATHGPSFGKRRKVYCCCKSITYVHPKVRLQDAQCMDCNRNLFKFPWEMVDMVRESEVLDKKH